MGWYPCTCCRKLCPHCLTGKNRQLQISFTVTDQECQGGCADLGGTFVLTPQGIGGVDSQYEPPTLPNEDGACRWVYADSSDLICDLPDECVSCTCNTNFDGQDMECEPGVIECPQTYFLTEAASCADCENIGCATGCAYTGPASPCECTSDESSSTGYRCVCDGPCSCVPNCDKAAALSIKVWLYKSADNTEWVVLVEIIVAEKVYMGEATFPVDGPFDCAGILDDLNVNLTVQNDAVNALCNGPTTCTLTLI